MSSKQQRITALFDYLKQCWDSDGDIPSQRQMAQACQMSLSTVNNYLSILEARGKITREPYKTRSIRIVETDVDKEPEDRDQVLAYIESQIEQGIIPTQQQIADACYLSRSSVRRILHELEEQEHITMGEGQRILRLKR